METTNELISIITPMYNGAKYIKETLNSVLAQTYKTWEMIVVNDGSVDEGPDIVSEYILKDKRIHLITQKNAGSSSARNNGLRHAAGRYICFLDADDIWHPTFLEKQLRFISRMEAKIAFTSYYRINAQGKEIFKPFIVPEKVDYRKLLHSCYISCSTSMLDKKKTGEVFFDERMGCIGDDFAFWLSILKLGGYACGNKEILVSYRIHTSGITKNKRKVIIPHFKVLYNIEKLGLFLSLYYMIIWGYISITKWMKCLNK